MTKYFLILFSLILSGCFRVGPDFIPPETDEQTVWTESDPAIHTEKDLSLGCWWENFRDETLNELVDFALKENYSLDAAVYRIIAARANLGFAIGEFYPQTQQLEGSSIRTHISANAPNTINADRWFQDSILGMRVAWELDIWGRFSRGIEVAYGELLASEEDYLDVKRILISDLVTAYIQQKTFLNRIAAFERNIKIQYRSVEIAKVRWEKGFESELDYAQAVTLWKETVAQKVALEVQLKAATTSLAILTGLTPEEYLVRFPIDTKPIHSPLDAAILYPAEILCQRPDLRRSLDLLYSQSARIGIAISDLLPRISFTGFLGFECASDTHHTANQRGKVFFSRNSLSYFYGPSFTMPILDYYRLENVVVEQYALFYEGVELYRNQVLQAYKEVEDSLTFFVKSIEETENLEESYLAAKRSVDISLLQYREGIADYTKVLNSLQLQVSVEDTFAQAEGNIGLAYALIYRSLGAF